MISASNMLYLFRFILIAGILFSITACAEDNPPAPEVVALTDKSYPNNQCPLPGSELEIAAELGSAGLMQNMAESPDSIRAIAGRLLGEALSEEATKTRLACANDCNVGALDEIIYRVIPTAYLAEENQREICLKFEAETAENPMLFEARQFESVAQMNDWIMDFSQGRGDDGKLLYERCSSNCSPRYTFLIGAQESGYEVRTEVQCGLARDKSDNRYRISTALRRSCAVN